MKELVVLYSGGTDSTCATVLSAGEYDRIHLITYRRFGLFHMEHAARNVALLRERFGADRFVHVIIPIDRIFREISYARYWRMLARYGLFLLSTCGLCRLAMHVRTIVYCRANNITRVCDGSNRHAAGGTSTDQNPVLVEGVRKMYARYGIEYATPVYDYDEPAGSGWADKLQVETPRLKSMIAGDTARDGGRTSGKLLHELGYFAQPNIKGSKADRRMQARCLQLILSNIFIYGWYLSRHTPDEFFATQGRFMGEKLDYCRGLLDGYVRDGSGSRLAKLAEDAGPACACTAKHGGCKRCLVKFVFPDH
jgi:predicted subunit of tRNA(5-methylaminomethyl-2-thiouridylate) methyltransferase